ncbi:LacI family DNA-binding transcriptional regulator [Ensifer soli]|uniref:LacI family DNA-binding transcriptional regulator n=1 Tax=Ciceribacter sp. sgz301302 TaxID=3342379 RepID=UPI0035BA9501
MKTPRHRTMEDFAQSCGVSRPTLSKYFDNPASVKPATRRRIEQALEASDYQPNHYARNLNRKRTRNVGIIVPTLADPFYTAAVSEIELRLREEGYWPIVISSHGSQALESEALRTIMALKVSGAIMAPLGLASDARGFETITQSIPIVCFDTYIAGTAPFIGNNNRQSVATMVDYLCRSGEAPVYFDIPHVNHNSPERLKSYIDTMTALGHEPLVFGNTRDYTWDFERIGYEQMEAILSRNALPGRTVLCANDRLAFGVMAAAFSQGKRVGRRGDCDLRVAAHDDHPLSRFTGPALTTMAQDFSGIARRSVETLLALMGDERADVAPMLYFDATLAMRQSA